MEQKINIAELLKDCPSGMELDCTMFDDIYFDCIDDDVNDIIKCYIQEPKHKIGISFNKYGHYSNINKSKCVIFPKGKTTWEGFVPPCKFKEGDIIYVDNFIAIFSNVTETGTVWYHCYYCIDTQIFKAKRDFGIGNIKHGEFRFATEEEKQILFDAIKANGYKWNAETKTLEELIEPIFEVGNKIEKCGYIFTIAEVKDDYYLTKCGNKIPIDNQDDFSLVPDKFDITTLKPFDKVLVRGDVGQKWTHDFFGFMDKDKGYPFVCVGHYVIQCIPYEKNEHLLGTTNDCDDYYKTWR